MATVAFVTARNYPQITSDDALAAMALSAKDIEVIAAPWDDPSVDWTRFDGIVLRSCWNYHLHPERFLRWLSSLPESKLFNPLRVVKWNLHKSYLQDLQKRGAAIPDTLWIPKGTSINISNLLKESGWERAVAKPAISATAHQTFNISISDARNWQPQLEAFLSKSDYLLQAFQPEIQEQGEWSLLFFDKQFSHAVLKKPRPNDFRVQNDFGGTTAADTPPPFVIDKAKEILSWVPEPLLYARVDGVISGTAFILMELELLEPSLFFQYNEKSPDRFAAALAKRLL